MDPEISAQPTSPISPVEQPVQPPPRPAQPLPTEPTSVKPPRKKWTAVLAGIIILLLLCGGGFLVLGKKSSAPTPAPIVTQAPTPTPDPTSNWQTYESHCGFTIKYPNSLNAEQAFSPNPEHADQQCASITAKDIKMGIESIEGYYLNFTRFKIGDTLWSTNGVNPVRSVQDYIKQSVQNDQNLLSLIKQIPTTYGSVKGVQYDAPGIGSNKAFIFQNGNYIYLVGWEDKYTNETNKQIISSLKFTGITDETANWKTYSNPKYSFSLKYPNTWSSSDVTSQSPDAEKLETIGFFENGVTPNLGSEGNPGNARMEIHISTNKQTKDQFVSFQKTVSGTTFSYPLTHVIANEGNKIYYIWYDANTQISIFSNDTDGSEAISKILSTFTFSN